MKIQDIRIGDLVSFKNPNIPPMKVIALFADGTVHTSHDGSEDYPWEFNANEINPY